MSKKIEVVFRFGGKDRRLSASRDSDGGLRVAVDDDDDDYGYGSTKNINLEAEEVEALCSAMNGLGWSVPRMEVPEVEKKDSCIGFRSED